MPLRTVSRYIVLARRKIKVGLPAVNLRDRCDQCPGQPNIQCQIVGNAPIVLNERTKQLPAPTRGCAQKGLIMQRSCANLSYQQVTSPISGERTKVEDESILEPVGLNVHLLSPNLAPE